jgi:oxygen-independent coproporphyrinogen-3 oxidase
MSKQLGLYLHIPFCIHRCRYCTATVVTGTSEAKRLYLEALGRELEASLLSLDGYHVSSIYLGGGSPSVMRPDDVAAMTRRFIGQLRDAGLTPPHGPEISIECMPQTIGTPSLSGLRSGGFTRYSLSMQSIIPAELEALDCDFTVRDIQNAVLFLQKFHIHNVNLDLMYGNPLQTLGSWKRTLRAARDFKPEHISLYPFPGQVDCGQGERGQSGHGQDDDGRVDSQTDGSPNLTDRSQADASPSQAETADMLEFACEFLTEMGYTRYTRYHFARPGKQCRHFLSRYAGENYLGFGLGARSLIDDISYVNTSDLNSYLSHSADFELITTDIMRLTEKQRADYQSASQKLLIEPPTPTTSP